MTAPTSTALIEEENAALAQLLIELAFLVPKGTDLGPSSAIGAKLGRYVEAIRANSAAAALAEQDATLAKVREALTQNESIGLSIDMLDVDRLREWARLLLVHGADIGHWGSVQHVAGKLQLIATSVEKAIKDIGIMRAALATDAQDATISRQEPT